MVEVAGSNVPAEAQAPLLQGRRRFKRVADLQAADMAAALTQQRADLGAFEQEVTTMHLVASAAARNPRWFA